MGRPVSAPLLKALHIYAFAAAVIGGSTCAYFLSISNGWKIRTGYSPKQNPNWSFFLNFSSLGFCIILFLYAVVELMSFFQVERIKVFDVGYIKPIIYIVSGISLLGLCGDLGIAAGSLMLASGIFWIALLLFIM